MTKARTLADNFAADINGITAGTGITGGGTSGTVTITNQMATTIDAKGDLVVGTGADAFGRLAVASTAGYVLAVDSAETTGLKWANGIPVVLNAQTATYTVVLTDAYKLVTMSVGSANDFLIPTNANVTFPIGTVINVIQIGAGQTTIKAVTAGTTTLNSTGATAAQPKLRAQYSAASCVKVATDTWYVIGDIA